MIATCGIGRGFGPMLAVRTTAPTDGGMIARLEQWAADVLAAIERDGKPAFRTAAPWRYQVGAAGSGVESFDRYAPFAFAKVEAIEPTREGDYDLNHRLRLVIAVGMVSKSDGDARLGTAAAAGVSEMIDRVVAAFDGTHPGDGFGCDDFYCVGLYDIVEHPKRYAAELHFEADWITV